MTDRGRVSHEIDAQRIERALGKKLVRKRRVILHANYSNRIAICNQLHGYLRIVLKWPGTHCEKPPTWIEKNNSLAGQSGKVCMQLLNCLIHFARLGRK